MPSYSVFNQPRKDMLACTVVHFVYFTYSLWAIPVRSCIFIFTWIQLTSFEFLRCGCGEFRAAEKLLKTGKQQEKWAEKTKLEQEVKKEPDEETAEWKVPVRSKRPRKFQYILCACVRPHKRWFWHTCLVHIPVQIWRKVRGQSDCDMPSPNSNSA